GLAERRRGGEGGGVVVGGVRPRHAVGALDVGEAPPAKRRVPVDRTPDAGDLDQVDADRHKAPSSQSGRYAIELTTASGTIVERSRSSGRNFPVRTRTVRSPYRCAPTMSESRSSPTIQVSSGSASSASSAASKY